MRINRAWKSKVLIYITNGLENGKILNWPILARVITMDYETYFKHDLIVSIVDLFVSLFVCSFFLLVPPKFLETPDSVVKVTGNSMASLSCRVFGYPPPTVVWSRGLVPLPQGRATVTNGTLNISNFSPQDAGPYQCKATNTLGSVSSLTTLNYVQPGEHRWSKKPFLSLDIFSHLSCQDVGPSAWRFKLGSVSPRQP